MRARQCTAIGAAWPSAVAAAALLTSGCGFHLQGREGLPELMASTYVQSADRHSEFDRQLGRRLREAGVLTSNLDEASAVVTIHRETGRRILSVSATNVPEEYEVYYTVTYSVRERGGSVVLPEQSLTLTRDYSYDETDVLGKAREEEILRQALATDLVRLVMRRLSALE